MTDTDGLRQQIIARLSSYGVGRSTAPRLADHLLPIVTAWAEQQARQRAAQELRAAVENIERLPLPPDGGIFDRITDTAVLRDRADALTAEDPASSLGRK
jgi:hypothetical protein